MLVGRLFHARETVTRNDRSPMVLSRVRGTIRRGQKPDRSRCRDSASSVQWSSSARYEVALWLRQQKASTASRNCILSGTRNQCKSWSRWVTWSYLRARHVSMSSSCHFVATHIVGAYKSHSRSRSPTFSKLESGVLPKIRTLHPWSCRHHNWLHREVRLFSFHKNAL